MRSSSSTNNTSHGMSIIPCRRSESGLHANPATVPTPCPSGGVSGNRQPVDRLGSPDRDGAALDLTARAIGLVGQVPLIGSGADRLAGSVADTSAQIRTKAVAARADVRSPALVIVPVLVLCLPLRVATRATTSCSPQPR